ncbi:WD40 repeat-like protein [Cryphonectria parasitica EP155]|uniref:WD40 repeat-like protein n=1 Tax=Cryphonectria parasitica (strain ATCC 38755 / EP155) TaxID=660469 RepID=A0A9P4YAX4_CRYP1|nr:WD40 repeat-like protein [Cryphonectria parasitica EP155]KAF3769996.1 WD40 repeat-like protein [Cryphonectria parasitica EP155]
MAKRKAQGALDGAATTKSEAFKKVKFNGAEQAAKSRRAPKAKASKAPAAVEATPLTTKSDAPITIQIVAGSYDRILHGVTATIHPSSSSFSPEVTFADTFLFNAHTSAIRCLALSPPSAPLPGQSQKVMLASGSTDERINVYNLSAHPPPSRADPDAALLSSLARRPILEDTRNRELGTLLHHSSTVTRLAFPTRSKLLSSSEDSTVAVTRTRDWSLLSTIKAPVPKVFGRPSGDTAPLGGTPSGVNDFAVHPSMKVMISVSKGERCMRLWNLVTGKKAGVLDFGRDLMQEIGEPRHSSGEGRKVVWGSSESEGDEFAVGFDRDVLVFGMDSKPRCRVMPDTRTKVHEFAYVKLDAGSGACVLAVATEDGRILFFSTALEDLDKKKSDDSKASPPRAKLLAQLGGKDAGVAGRVKDFKILQPESTPGIWYIISASSDGKLRAWALPRADLKPEEKKKSGKAKAAGKLLGTYETQNRITCVEAFVMIPRPEGVEESDVELEEPEAESSGDSDDE